MAPVRAPVVLLVEDDLAIRSATSDLLEAAGFAVFGAEDAAAALRSLGPHVDILFTDINMPGDLDGRALTCVIRNLRPEVLLIATSGADADGARGLPDGAQFVEKPYAIGAVTCLMREMLAAKPRGVR